MTLNTSIQFENFDPTRPESTEVKPPFPYIEINWHNGFAVAEKSSGAKHFGGWQISEENAGRAIATFGSIYPMFGESTMWAKGKGDGEYPARSSRSIVAAPIATRAKWYDGRDGKKGSTKTQFIVYLADISKEGIVTPYGPALIHGGSYHSGKSVSEALQAWSNHINVNRQSSGIGSIPAWAFYGYFGTFGDKRITREVGSGEKNIIVPCQVAFPKETTTIQNFYVGDAIATEIMSLRKQAQAWLDDAKKKTVTQEQPAEPESPVIDDDFTF